MSALSHIADYLKEHFAGHDTETLMQHFETAIEAKVEEGLAELKAEIQALRDELTGGRPSGASAGLTASEAMEAAKSEPTVETGSAA